MKFEMSAKAFFAAIKDSTLHALEGNWYNADLRQFYELRAENGFYTTVRFHNETEEVFVVATGIRQGVWRKVAQNSCLTS